MNSASEFSLEEPTTKKARHLPGDELVWMFIIGDMCCFSLFFGFFAYYRVNDAAVFQQAQALLDVQAGTANTILLLCSSWMVALALRAAKRGLLRQGSWLMLLAALLGSGFLWLKGMEYVDKSNLGITFLTNDFWIFYYLVTGMHYFHVLLGVPLLLYFVFSLRRAKRLNDQDISNLECGGIYWHMVDLLWLVIFPLIYLLP